MVCGKKNKLKWFNAVLFKLCSWFTFPVLLCPKAGDGSWSSAQSSHQHRSLCTSKQKALPMLVIFMRHTVGRTFRLACQQPLHSPLVFLWSRCPLWLWTCGWTCCRYTCEGRLSFPLQSPPVPEAWSNNHNPSQPLCHCVLHLPQYNMCWNCVLKNLQLEFNVEQIKVSFW